MNDSDKEMKTIYEEYKDKEDGFLYIVYSDQDNIEDW